MSVYKRGQKFFVYVPRREGGRAVRTTGTSDRSTARSMDEMLRRLCARREWDFLDKIHEGRLSVAELYDADARGGLDDLRARLSDVDLQQYVDGWLAAVRTRTSETSDTAEHYLVALRSLMPDGKPFYRSDLSYPLLTSWLSTRHVGPSTKRKYRAGVSSFLNHLLAAGVLSTNPIRMVKAPKASPPRMQYLTLTEAKQLVDAQPEPYRTISALLHCGLEISAALAVKRRDVDAASRDVRARGTKTHSRDRVVAITQWAWPYIERHIANLLPEAPLFAGINRWMAAKAHNAACKSIGRTNYRQHDARHTFAVAAIRAGASFEFVASQLGHSSIQQTVSVYGRYRPTSDERRAWEKRAEEMERLRLSVG